MKRFFPSLRSLLCLSFMSSSLFAQQKTDTARFMVAAAHPLATKAGMDIMARGGNAFDAITASAFMLSVVEPTMSGLGGRLQTIYRKASGETGGIDATTQVPASYKPTPKEEEDGFGAAGVPGMVKGIIELHGKNGKLPLKTVMAPAIQTAQEGFIVLKDEAARMASAIKEIRRFPSTAKHFLINDSTPIAGSRFQQPVLAKTLQRIAKDKGKSFYYGGEARILASEISKGGGYLTYNDIMAYSANPAKLLRGSYRGYEIIGLGMPSYGAIVIEMLHLLEQQPLDTCSEATYLIHQANAHKKAYDDRKFLRKEEEKLIDKSFAASRWKDETTTSAASPEDARNGHTTHLVASDEDGNVVSLTQSLGPVMGSKITAPGGFLLATSMGPYLSNMRAGERAASHIAPILVLKDGVPVLALGAAGGARIVPAVVQVISRFIDRQLPLEKALAAARVFQLEKSLQIENHKEILWEDLNTLQLLRQQKIPVTEVRQTAQFGRVHAVQRLPNGEWIGAADPDWSGSAGQ